MKFLRAPVILMLVFLCWTAIAHFWEYRGDVLARSGPWEGAVRAYERSIRCLPQRMEPHYKLGRLYQAHARETGNTEVWEKARVALEGALSLVRSGYEADLALFEVSWYSGREPVHVLIRRLDALNAKYPNHWTLRHYEARWLLPNWSKLSMARRLTLTDTLRDLLHLQYEAYHPLLTDFARQTGSWKLSLSLIAGVPEAFVDLSRVFSTLPVRVDYEALYRLLERAPDARHPLLALMRDPSSAELSRRSQWLNRFGRSGTRLEAEHLIGISDDGQNGMDQGAMYFPGWMWGLLRVDAGTDRLTLTAGSTLVSGIPAYMTVWWNNRRLGGTYVDAPEGADFVFPLGAEEGPAEGLLLIRFENDAADPDRGEDRNLFIHRVAATHA